MADINDLIKQFYSVNDLKEMALPIDTTKFRIDLLCTKLNDITRRHQLANRTDKMAVFEELVEMKSDLVFLWQTDEGLITPHMFKIRAVRGFARVTDQLVRELKHDAFQQHQEESVDDTVGPDEIVLEQLRRKPIRESGVIIGYDGPLNLALNARIIFENDTRWRGRMEYDELAGIATIDRDFLLDHTCYSAKLWLEEHYQNMCLPKNEVGLVLDNVGRNHSFHPIQELLNKLPVWDEVPRIDNLFHRYFSAADTPLHRAYSSKFMISAVARAFEPGCKVDTIPILIGRQGAMKSEALKLFAFDPKYFTDTTLDIRSKDAFINIQGKWIVEFAECETVFKAGHSLSKSWITSQSDRYRPPYAQYASDHPRGCCIIGTTNISDLPFLADSTDSRRFWALLVGDVDYKQLKQDIPLLWAEALYRYRAQETWWLSKDLEVLRREQNDRYALGDSWEDNVYRFLNVFDRNANNHVQFMLEDVFDFINLDIKQRDMKASKRLAAILRRYGAFKQRVSFEGGKKNMWFWASEVEDGTDV